MENYQITAAQISASTQLDENYVPSHGRLNYMGDGGAWAAKVNDSNQWIQIDLRVEANVTFVATQGRYADLYQRVTEYKLQYSKDGLSFQVYKEARNNSDKVRVRMGSRKYVQIIINCLDSNSRLTRKTFKTILSSAIRPCLRHIREFRTLSIPVVQTNCSQGITNVTTSWNHEKAEEGCL